MTKFNKQFKVDVVQYYHDHRDLSPFLNLLFVLSLTNRQWD